MITEFVESLSGKKIKLLTPENDEDLKTLDKLEEDGEIDRIQSFGDRPEDAIKNRKRLKKN